MCQVEQNVGRDGAAGQPPAYWDAVSNLLGVAVIRNYVVVSGNDRFLKMIGRTQDDVRSGGVSMKAIIPPEYDLIFARSMGELKSRGCCHPFELELLCSDSTRLGVLFAPSLLPGQNEGFMCFILDMSVQQRAEQELQQAHDQLESCVLHRTAALAKTVERMRREIARRKSAETSLRRKSNQLRSLASQLTLAEYRERSRIASVLHDQIQQLLVGASFRSAVLIKSPHEQVKKLASEIHDLLASALKGTRTLTGELSPSVLSERGLVGGLRWLASWMHDKFGLVVNVFIVKVQDLSQPHDMTVLLFQSVWELLFNVVKHARTKAADVHVTRLKRSLRIIVTDKGQGFDVRRLNRCRKSRGMGLFSIQERLAMMGGSMRIVSKPGKGSRFTLIAP